MDLPRGITGFRHVDDPPLPVWDFAAFRRHCYAAASALGGKVLTIETPIHGVANFARAVLELPAGSIAVLLNSHFPAIAFAEPTGDEEVGLRFIDAPSLVEVLRSFGVYEVPEASGLAAPLMPESSRDLAPAEMEQVKYWGPQRIGDAVFNFWD